MHHYRDPTTQQSIVCVTEKLHKETGLRCLLLHFYSKKVEKDQVSSAEKV